ncbi:hypothetical protein B5S28_g2120 [[Candida] boidinii]|nr:hypothetical protein B5S28_g2120 [[Candida] boidinii]
MPLRIQGFYFDAEKGRYFKIIEGSAEAALQAADILREESSNNSDMDQSNTNSTNKNNTNDLMKYTKSDINWETYRKAEDSKSLILKNNKRYFNSQEWNELNSFNLSKIISCPKYITKSEELLWMQLITDNSITTEFDDQDIFFATRILLQKMTENIHGYITTDYGNDIKAPIRLIGCDGDTGFVISGKKVFTYLLDKELNIFPYNIPILHGLSYSQIEICEPFGSNRGCYIVCSENKNKVLKISILRSRDFQESEDVLLYEFYNHNFLISVIPDDNLDNFHIIVAKRVSNRNVWAIYKSFRSCTDEILNNREYLIPSEPIASNWMNEKALLTGTRDGKLHYINFENHDQFSYDVGFAVCQIKLFLIFGGLYALISGLKDSLILVEIHPNLKTMQIVRKFKGYKNKSRLGDNFALNFNMKSRIPSTHFAIASDSNVKNQCEVKVYSLVCEEPIEVNKYEKWSNSVPTFSEVLFTYDKRRCILPFAWRYPNEKKVRSDPWSLHPDFRTFPDILGPQRSQSYIDSQIKRVNKDMMLTTSELLEGLVIFNGYDLVLLI